MKTKIKNQASELAKLDKVQNFNKLLSVRFRRLIFNHSIIF